MNRHYTFSLVSSGWITRHSYIVYGPLCACATVFINERTPDDPDPGDWWRLIEKQCITIFCTTPTAIRTFMKLSEEWPNKYDLSSLHVPGSVGEPLNPEAFEWHYCLVGKDKCPIVDACWQTEAGMHILTTLVGEPIKPGFAGAVPFGRTGRG